jgi:molybdate transport system ATP-binding protein
MLEFDFEAQVGGFVVKVAVSAPSDALVALFGRSGAGKTTVLNTLAGLVRPSRGHMRLDDTLFFSLEQGVAMPIEQRGIGYVFQEDRLFPHLSVEQNLQYGLRRAKGWQRRSATSSNASSGSNIKREEIIDLLALGPLLERRTPSLSGGERQRVALARALLCNPRLLLLDEPLAALDMPRKLEVMDYIERLRQLTRIPMVLVSHALEEVARLADILVVLEHGQVAAKGPIGEVLTRPELAPLLGDQEASSIIAGDITVAEHDGHLATLGFAGGQLQVRARGKKAGEPIRVRIRASDVALSLKPLEDVSISNILAARVLEVSASPSGNALVVLDVTGTKLLASITRASAERLRLEPGLSVWALTKSVALIESNPGAS